MITTTMGYKKPQTGDRGSTYFPALEYNIDRQDSHKHDGTDGVQINPKDLNHQVTSISSASWAAVAGQAGTYSQTITMPTGYTMDLSLLQVWINGSPDDGARIFPSIVKASSNTFTIYVNDNTLNLKVIYG